VGPAHSSRPTAAGSCSLLWAHRCWVLLTTLGPLLLSPSGGRAKLQWILFQLGPKLLGPAGHLNPLSLGLTAMPHSINLGLGKKTQ